MSNKDEFYIGWEEEAPPGYQRFSIVFLSVLAVTTVFIMTLWLLKSDGFADSRYEYGKESVYKGVIYEYPAPMLVVFNPEDTLSVPLVNFGKFGVTEPMKYFKSQMRNNLLDYEVELRGTIIEFDGKKWLELTDEERSLLSFKKLESPSPPLNIKNTGRKEITGEIVDPKCFFGAMKPGFGKVHLSCAVRCISGGIPPILVSQNENGLLSYYFLTGEGGRMINDEILSFVGIPVGISGNTKMVIDWNVLEIKPEDVSIASNYTGTSLFKACQTESIKPSLAVLE